MSADSTVVTATCRQRVARYTATSCFGRLIVKAPAVPTITT